MVPDFLIAARREFFHLGQRFPLHGGSSEFGRQKLSAMKAFVRVQHFSVSKATRWALSLIEPWIRLCWHGCCISQPLAIEAFALTDVACRRFIGTFARMLKCLEA
jgi:hypothetical protein